MDTSQEEPFPFEELPSELQYHILEQGLDHETKQMILSLMQTSKGMRERFLNAICRRKISTIEFIRYLDERPQLFAFFKKDSSLDDELIYKYIGMLFSFFSQGINPNDPNTTRYVLLDKIVSYYNEDGHLSVVMSDLGYVTIKSILEIINDFTEVDLLTTYRILSHRLGCMNADPEYAKNETLRRLQEHINERKGSLYQMLSLYTYLIVNARVMNLLSKEIHFDFGNEYIDLQYPNIIPEDLSFQFLESLTPMPTEEQNKRLQSIMEQIPILIRQIRTYIEKL